MLPTAVLPALCFLAGARVAPQQVGRPHAARASASMAGALFKIEDVAAGKAAVQMEKFCGRVDNILSKPPNPTEEAWQPNRKPQVKQMGEAMRSVAELAAAADACDLPLGVDDPVGDDPEQERLARTRVFGANSFVGSSALTLVSFWPDHVSVDACAINPSSLSKGEMAERAILRHVTAAAEAAGCADVRLDRRADRFFQNDGDDFYAPAGFFPADDADGAEGRLRFRAGFVAENAPLPS